MSERPSWHRERTAELSSLLEACIDVPEISSSLDMLPAAAAVCNEVVWEPASADNGDGDDDDGENDNNSTASGTDSNDAAPLRDWHCYRFRYYGRRRRRCYLNLSWPNNGLSHWWTTETIITSPCWGF